LYINSIFQQLLHSEFFKVNKYNFSKLILKGKNKGQTFFKENKNGKLDIVYHADKEKYINKFKEMLYDKKIKYSINKKQDFEYKGVVNKNNYLLTNKFSIIPTLVPTFND
jgi:hypothetical protein